MNIPELPKVELHLHLDCCLSLDVVQRIDPSITESTYRDQFVAPAKCHDLADFLKRAPAGFRLMQTELQLQMVVDDLFEQLVADNVIYAEIRYAPLQHLLQGLQPTMVVDIVEQAVAKAIRRTGVEARVILCTLRHFDESQSLETVQLVNQFKGSLVTGFDIAADEAGFPIDAHLGAFQFAQDNHIFCTAHAGEACGAESVWETLEHFAPQRIGHGVRSIEDAKLIEYLVRENIHLEVCPTSNIQVDVFDEYEDHPAERLFASGVQMSLSTDTRTISNIDLNAEYQRMHELFGWDEKKFRACNRMALEAAFIPDSLRDKLLSLI